MSTPTTGTEGRKQRYQPTQLVIGLSLLAAVVGASVLAPLIAPFDPLEQQLDNALQAPSAAHWFGTDNVGRDVFSRVLFGGRDLLILTTVATVVATLIGLTLGVGAALHGRWLDTAASRLAEIQLAVPSIVLALVVLSLNAGSDVILIAILITAGWVLTFRVVRSHCRSVLSRPYIEAAVLSGASKSDIVRRHLLRSLLPLLVVSVTLNAAVIAALVTNLGFLGLGTAPPEPDWGQMVAAGQSRVGVSPWLSLTPGIVLVILLVSLQLIGDGLADRWDRLTGQPSQRRIWRRNEQ